MIALVWAAQAAEPARGAADYRSHVDQALFFAGKEWYPDAEAELQAALRLPGGAEDPEVWFLLAKMRFATGDLAGAIAAAQQAATIARDEDQREQVGELLDYFGQRFGFVRLERRGGKAPVALAAASPLYDPDLERWVARVQAELTAPVDLPLEVALPVGEYRVDGRSVSVAASAHQTLDLGGQAPLAVTPGLEAHLGAIGIVGGWYADRAPSGFVGVAVPVRVRSAELAVTAQWTAQAPFGLGAAPDLAGFSAGVRAGPAPFAVGSVQLRPAVTVLAGRAPAVALACAPDIGVAPGTTGPAPGEPWACAPPRGAGGFVEARFNPTFSAVGGDFAAAWEAGDTLEVALRGVGALTALRLPSSGGVREAGASVGTYRIDGDRGTLGAAWLLSVGVIYRP